MADSNGWAPGWPGIEPRWTSSAKQGVGASLSPASGVTFTVSHGIFNEVYYPRVDQACTRDMGMMVASDDGFFSEEKRNTDHKVSMLAPGVPAYALTNTCFSGAAWRLNQKCRTIPCGKILRVELLQEAVVRWSHDGWEHAREVASRPTGLGISFVDLPTASMKPGEKLVFTIRWKTTGAPERGEFSVVTSGR